MPKHKTKEQYDENWYWYLTGQNKIGFTTEYESSVKVIRRISGLVPGGSRCFECNRPMSGIGGRLLHIHPSSFSPRLCDSCEHYIREKEAGAEVELSMLFADIRGSTVLAETMTAWEFKQLIQRFYQAAGDVLVQHNGMVNRLMGDQVIGLFAPRFAGSAHATIALTAARDLLRATGHADPSDPWVPVGIGVHTGRAYVGAVGTSEGVNEIAVLGSAPNLAARLSSQANPGEILLSQSAVAAAHLAPDNLEHRDLVLKGIPEPLSVYVAHLEAGPTSP
jgi:adenylate cyclase